MNANDAPKGAGQSPTTTRNALQDYTANETTVTRWGQWWRMASAHARLRRDVNQLRARVDKLEARVDDLEAEMHRCTGGAA
jgi:ubiquinone biosynthesis protein UbiJ